MLRKNAHILLLGIAAALMLTLGSTNAFAQNSVGFVTENVTNFQLIHGTQQGLQNSVQRVRQTYWIFDTSRGVFYFYPLEYYQVGLPPFVGTYRVQGNKVFIQAVFNFNVTTGFTSGEVLGEIDFSSGQPVAKVTWVSGAAQGTSVGGGWGNSGNSAYQITATLKRAW